MSQGSKNRGKPAGLPVNERSNPRRDARALVPREPGAAPTSRPDDATPEGAEVPPEVAAAMALARKGELGRAVQVLEHSGAHAHAAVIRLEYAYSLCGALQRIAMLREGCARTPGDTPEGKALHRALAEALLRQATPMEDGAPRRGLLIEAAAALETADEGDKAGDIYRQLGLLRRAARAYQSAGAISRLEYTHSLIERLEQARVAIDTVEREVDEALRQGNRRLALALLQDRLGAHDEEPGDVFSSLGTNAPGPSTRGLARRLRRLEDALPERTRVDLKFGDGRVTRVHNTTEFTLGRSPDASLPLSGVGLSRVHVQLSVASSLFVGGAPPDAPDLVVVAIDQGSRSGTFWNGDPLEPGVPTILANTGELGLGFADSVSVCPVFQGPSSVVGALVHAASSARWSLFLPEGGPLMLEPGRQAPARVLYRRPFFELAAESETQVYLGRLPLGRGAHVELLIGDRLRLEPPVGDAVTLEVVG